MTIEPRHLTREDLRSSTWARFEQDLQARIEELRAENDSFSDHETTTKRRGRIAELKGLMVLAEQARQSEGSLKSLHSVQPFGAF